jgi:pimeloyl-ACP methyl ester carboxylesterase
VLVHGSWLDHMSWEALLPHLSKRFDVIAYDRRGHSQSLLERISLHEPTALPLLAGDADGAALLRPMGESRRPSSTRREIRTGLRVDLPAVSSVEVPVLLTDGDQSPPFYSKILEKPAAALPNAERRSIPGAGHVPQLTHPEQYVDIVSDFLMSS